jgi:hypothetical protein
MAHVRRAYATNNESRERQRLGLSPLSATTVHVADTEDADGLVPLCGERDGRQIITRAALKTLTFRPSLCQRCDDVIWHVGRRE